VLNKIQLKWEKTIGQRQWDVLARIVMVTENTGGILYKTTRGKYKNIFL
jgi:hypothetical protein